MRQRDGWTTAETAFGVFVVLVGAAHVVALVALLLMFVGVLPDDLFGP